jgi:hypothetical protein
VCERGRGREGERKIEGKREGERGREGGREGEKERVLQVNWSCEGGREGGEREGGRGREGGGGREESYAATMCV